MRGQLGAFTQGRSPSLPAVIRKVQRCGLASTALVLCYEHVIVRPHDLSRVNRSFFTANGVIGIGLFAFALADLIVHGLAA